MGFAIVIAVPLLAGLFGIVLARNWSVMRPQTRILLGALALAMLGGSAMIAGVYTGWAGSACDPNLADCSAYVARASASHTLFNVGRALVVVALALFIVAVLVAVRRLVAGRRGLRIGSTSEAGSGDIHER